MKYVFADEIFYIHQRPYSIRRVNKRSGGVGRIVREITGGEERSLFALKACSRQNQPIPDLTVEHPCHQTPCPELCFAIPNPERGRASDAPALVKRCACRHGYKINPADSLTCIADTAVCEHHELMFPNVDL